MADIIPAPLEQQKDILWKKYLSKKKSFAKAQVAVADFERLDRPGYQKWLATFAVEEQAEAFLQRHSLERYDQQLHIFRELCAVSGVSKADILYRVQSECIAKDKFFWGIVAELYENASAEAERRFKEKLQEYLKAHHPGRGKDLFESFQRTCHGSATSQEDAPPAQPEAPDAPTEPGMEAKKLYRTLCLRHHPDKTGVYNESLWLEIQEAYEKGSLKKLRELMKRPVIKDENTSAGLSCDDIRNMIFELEQQFKPVRAKMRDAKQSRAWGFHTWSAERREIARRVIEKFLKERIAYLAGQLKKRKSEVAAIFTPGRWHKYVQIIVEQIPNIKTKYMIRLHYGIHAKYLPVQRGRKMDDAEFAELCVVTALRALKCPCRVSMILPAELRAKLPDIPPGFIYGSEYGNLISRHVVTFDDKRDLVASRVRGESAIITSRGNNS